MMNVINLYKQHLNKNNKIIKIKSAIGLAKHVINYRVIPITNCYQIVIGKVCYLIIIAIKIFFQWPSYKDDRYFMTISML